MSKILRKSLAGIEDLLLGPISGIVSQLRGQNTVPVTPIDLPIGFDTTSQLKDLDVNKFRFAIQYIGGNAFIYCYSPTDTTAADDVTYFKPNNANGRWKKFSL